MRDGAIRIERFQYYTPLIRHPNFATKSKGHGMSISAGTLRFDEHTMWVELADGRTIGVPLAWFPRLLHATLEQRHSYRIGPTGGGLHWDDLDEDISVAGLLEGRGDMTHRRSSAA
jgi:Protein of unknown function (DUF2442)